MLDRRVYVVEDDEALRRTIRRALTDFGIYTEEFNSAEALLEGYSERPLGVILLDMRLPGMSGLELLDRLETLMPANPVVMISGYGDIPSAVRAVRRGALDFLQKPFRKDKLISIIQSAFERIEEVDAAGSFETLTAREKEVLFAFADGQSNKAVASRLQLSPRTVEMHRARIIRKLGVCNLTQALLRARDVGLIR